MGRAWILFVALLTLLVLACSLGGFPSPCSEYPYCNGSAAGGHANDGLASAKAMLVQVEPGKILTAQPGEGNGVFVEYASGGHWTIWWMCKSANGCTYVVNATASSGKITNLAGYGETSLNLPPPCPPSGGGWTIYCASYEGGTNATSDGGEGEAGSDAGVGDAGPLTFPVRAWTTQMIQGVTFDADPGVTVEVSASLDTFYDGTLFYFVDNSVVKNGYTRSLTDPLDFQPTSP